MSSFWNQSGLDLAFEEIGARHDNVVAGAAGQKLGFEDLVGIEDVVIDLDTSLCLEIGDRILGDIVRPIVDVENGLFLSKSGGGENGNSYGEREDVFHSVLELPMGIGVVTACGNSSGQTPTLYANRSGFPPGIHVFWA